MREHHIASTSKFRHKAPPSGGAGKISGLVRIRPSTSARRAEVCYAFRVMPAFRDNRRLVTYVPVDVAALVDRHAKADGRTVSGWLASLIASALGALLAAPDPEPPSKPRPRRVLRPRPWFPV